jgi:DNA-binding MarR family transcriptional regulator
MGPGTPLPTLLSQVLVAFTIEFDNEAEHRMDHRTTAGGPGGGSEDAPWLVSQVMWANVLQYVGADGTQVRDIHARSRTTSDSLPGLQRWGYVTIDPWPHHGHGGRAPEDAVVRLTRAGRRARGVWQPLAPEVEERWRSRFGAGAIDDLLGALVTVADGMERPLPRYLPVVHPTLNGKAAPNLVPLDGLTGTALDGPTDLSVLVARVLLGFTLDFETESRISLPISANTLRVLDDTGVRVRELPGLTGVSKEANAMATGFLERRGCAEVVPDPSAPRGKMVRLTAKGRGARAKYRRILMSTEETWKDRCGTSTLNRLRHALERLTDGGPTGPDSLLFTGIVPYPEGWRASVRPPVTLPHYPMVLHRGGYPDGS